jgi:hypothetical protein
MTSKAPEMSYGPDKVDHSFYEFLQILPQIGTQFVPLGPSGGQQTIFEIPPNTSFNLSKSFVEFSFTPVALNGAFNWVHVNGFPFWNQLLLYPKSGLEFVNIYAFNHYMNMVSRQGFKFQDYITWDKVNFAGFFEGLSPCNSIATSALRPDNAVVATVNTSTAVTSFNEAAYVIVGGSGTATPVVNVRISLDKILNTMFSLDKNLSFSQVIYMKMMWSPTTDIYFSSTSASDATAGTASATTASINGLCLYFGS